MSKKTKKQTMGNAVEIGDPGELVTVRHSATGKYMECYHGGRRISAPSQQDDGSPFNVGWYFGDQDDASILTRKVAAAAAAAYIALTGDTGVELEPVVEAEL